MHVNIVWYVFMELAECISIFPEFFNYTSTIPLLTLLSLFPELLTELVSVVQRGGGGLVGGHILEVLMAQVAMAANFSDLGDSDSMLVLEFILSRLHAMQSRQLSI